MILLACIRRFMSNSRENGNERSPASATPDHGGAAPRSSGSSSDPVIGRVVDGKYAIESVLGIGGFGTVYRAIQRPVGRPVALKIVHPRHAHDAQLRARFFREAKLVARLRDRVVVTLHDYGESPEVGLYMAFELIEGITLAELLKSGAQPPERVANILLQLLRALSEAHGLGMIHRDLKPGNIMLVEDAGAPLGEGVRLLDFGIAKLKVEMAGQDPSLATQQGLFMGTPSYISPEQARASGEVDGRSDLYSLGVVGFALLAGKNPFVGASVVETILAHCNTPPPPLDDSLQVPAQMEGALRKALEKDPEDRFASAMQMAAAIESAVPSLISGVFTRSWSESVDTTTPSGIAAVSAMPETPQSQTWSQALPALGRSRPLRWLALLLFLFLTAGLLTWWLMDSGGSETAIRPAVSTREPEPPIAAPADPESRPKLPALDEAPAIGDPEEASDPGEASAVPARDEAAPGDASRSGVGETAEVTAAETGPSRSSRPARERAPPRRERAPDPQREPPAEEASEPTLVIPEF